MAVRGWMSLALGLLAAAAACQGACAAGLGGRATIFAPGVVSGPDPDIAPSFDPSRSRLVFSRVLAGRFTVMEAARLGDGWSTPTVARFSGRWTDLEATIAPSGRYLVFASNRPAPGEADVLTTRYFGASQEGGRLWRVDLGAAGAHEPQVLPPSVNISASVWSPAIAANDELFFMATDATTGRFRLMAAKAQADGGYEAARPLAFSTGGANDVDPAVERTRRFLVFSSDRDAPAQGDASGPERLFIAFAPTSAHPVVCRLDIPGWENRSESQVEARLSLDGRRLYFSSRHPDHSPGGPAAGAWDNGRANIWMIDLQSSLWRGAGGACRKAQI